MPRTTQSGKASKDNSVAFLEEKRSGLNQFPITATESDSDSERDLFSSSTAISTDAESYDSPEANRGRSKSRSIAESHYTTEANRSRSRSQSIMENASKTFTVEAEPQKQFLSRTKVSQSAVSFGDRPPAKASRERSVSQMRSVDEDDDYKGINAESSSRHRSHSRNHMSKFLVLEIKKIRGMKSFPVTRPYSENMKIRITATFQGIAKTSPQILREGAFDPNQMTFMWKISTTEAKIIEENMEFQLKLTIERDESQRKMKWTHIVGEAIIPGKTEVTIGGGPYTIDLQPTNKEHGRQQLHFTVHLWDDEQY